MAGNILGGVSSAIGSSTYVASASSMLSKSKVLVNASDSIRRTTGIDIRRAMGGKTAAEIAETRLQKEYDGPSKYTGGYQGIQIPIET